MSAFWFAGNTVDLGLIVSGDSTPLPSFTRTMVRDNPTPHIVTALEPASAILATVAFTVLAGIAGSAGKSGYEVYNRVSRPHAARE